VCSPRDKYRSSVTQRTCSRRGAFMAEECWASAR
jgi:hypothetical protein